MVYTNVPFLKVTPVGSDDIFAPCDDIRPFFAFQMLMSVPRATCV